MNRIGVIGAGYVGLTYAVCFASRSNVVTLCEHDKSKLELVRLGETPFHEPGLKILLRTAVKSGKLRFASSIEEIIPPQMIQVAVGTPSGSNGGLDLEQVQYASEQVGRTLRNRDDYRLVVVRSTVMPGATETIVKPNMEFSSGKRAGPDFGLVMQPEFLREGSAVHDVLHPDRLIIGEHDKRAGDALLRFYRSFYGDNLPPVMRTGLCSAELIKLANNAFLATRVSLINEIANVCERASGADVAMVAKAIGLDKRIGPSFLRAGLGFGGSCLPKDVRALMAFSETVGYNARILAAVLDTNERQALHGLDMLRDQLGDLKGKRIALLGLSFKPDTDDMREAPSVKIVAKLLQEGAEIVVHDPVAMKKARAMFGDRILFATDPIQCLRGADGCLVATEWREYKDLTPQIFERIMKRPLIVDGRRIYAPDKFVGKVEYQAIGKGRQ